MFTRHSTGTATAIPTRPFQAVQASDLPSYPIHAPAAQATESRRSRGFWVTALSGLAAMYPVGWDGGWMFDETGRVMPGWDPNADRGQ